MFDPPVKECVMIRSIWLSLLLACALHAGPVTVELWPGAAPGETGGLPAEGDLQKPTDKLVGGKTVMKVGNVTRPTITFYAAAKERNTGAAVVIAPGGGYNILAWDLEGVEVAQWMNTLGVNAAVLKYRVPARRGTPRETAPQQDAQRAMRVVRSRAAEWGLDPNRVGMLGFSAGGHLTGMTCMNSGQALYEKIDATDELSSRPDFGVLIYAGGFVEGEAIRPEVKVDQNTPPMFLAHAYDDRVPIENTLMLAMLLKKAGVAAEVHVYAAGGHGFGLRRTDEPCTAWPDRCAEWMKKMKIIDPK
jgi:acetyl esterase/lipase